MGRQRLLSQLVKLEKIQLKNDFASAYKVVVVSSAAEEKAAIDAHAKEEKGEVELILISY